MLILSRRAYGPPLTHRTCGEGNDLDRGEVPPCGPDTLILGFGLGKDVRVVSFIEVSRAVPSERGCFGAFLCSSVGSGGSRAGGWTPGWSAGTRTSAAYSRIHGRVHAAPVRRNMPPSFDGTESLPGVVIQFDGAENPQPQRLLIGEFAVRRMEYCGFASKDRRQAYRRDAHRAERVDRATARRVVGRPAR